MYRLTATVLAAATILLVGTAARPAAQASAQGQGIQLPVRLTAFAVNMSNIGTGTSGTAEIRIEQWSSAAERKRLIETMLNKGQDALLSAVQKVSSKGRMRFPGWMGPDPHQAQLGWDLRYAWHVPAPEGGHQIVLGFDRYIGFWEARNQPRTVDYPFSLVQILLNKDGEGEGKYAVATKLSFDKKKNQLEIENYSTEPIRLNNIKMESMKKKT
jgi:hypothetical protein